MALYPKRTIPEKGTSVAFSRMIVVKPSRHHTITELDLPKMNSNVYLDLVDQVRHLACVGDDDVLQHLVTVVNTVDGSDCRSFQFTKTKHPT